MPILTKNMIEKYVRRNFTFGTYIWDIPRVHTIDRYEYMHQESYTGDIQRACVRLNQGVCVRLNQGVFGDHAFGNTDHVSRETISRTRGHNMPEILSIVIQEYITYTLLTIVDTMLPDQHDSSYHVKIKNGVWYYGHCDTVELTQEHIQHIQAHLQKEQAK